jgi:hypothetical protein
MNEKTLEWLVRSVNDREPNPPLGYVVCFLVFLDRGFGILASHFMRALMHYYGVELHKFNPNSIMETVVFVTVCEGYLGFRPIGTSSSTCSRWRFHPRTKVEQKSL